MYMYIISIGLPGYEGVNKSLGALSGFPGDHMDVYIYILDVWNKSHSWAVGIWRVRVNSINQL